MKQRYYSYYLVGLLLGLSRPDARGQLRFAAPIKTTFNADAVRALTYDLNNDFVPDLVIAGGGGTKAVVLLGIAGGTFSPPQYIPTTGYCGGVALGNSNCDGYPDLWVSEFGNPSTRTGSVQVLPGVAGGGFGTPVVVPVNGGNPQHVAAADLNGDGKTDFVTVDKLSGTLAVLRTTGACAPTYGPSTDYSTASGAFSAELAVLVDLTHDGIQDVLVLNQVNPSQHGLSLLPGTAAGTFGTAITYPTGAGMPLGIALADLNGDTLPDVVLPLSSGDLGIFFGRATAPLLGGRVNLPLGAAVADVTISDVDGDAKPDLVAVLGTGAVVVLRGLGSGAFAAPLTVANLTLSGSYVQVVAADFNGDFKNDLAVSSSGTVQVLLNTMTPLGTSSARPTTALTIHPNPAQNGFTVQLPAAIGGGRAELLNGLGQIMRRQAVAPGAGFSVETNGLAAGVYLLRVLAGSTALTRRIVVE